MTNSELSPFRDAYEKKDYKNAIIYYNLLKQEDPRLASLLEYEMQKIRMNLNFVISLTSYPRRIEGSIKTLNSIFSQNEDNIKVVMWLTYEEFPRGLESVPTSIKELLGDRFSIRWCHNLLAYNKLIPALKEFPEKIIITIDDDVIYPENWLKATLDAYMIDPEAVHGHRCRVITFTENGEIANYTDWEKSPNQYDPNKNYFITGMAGALYPPGAFAEALMDEKIFMRICKYNDDIWFWAMEVLNETRIRPVKNGAGWNYDKRIPGSQDVCLWKENQAGRNDRMMQNVLRQFPELKKYLKLPPPSYFHSSKAAIKPQPINVSVVMPVYNSEVYLERSINMVLSETDINLELIIIDDGSTDRSSEIIENFQKRDQRIIVVSKKNEGQGIGRNIGIQIARGEYIYFLDSDDFLAPGALSQMYAACEKHTLDLCSVGSLIGFFTKPLEYVSAVPTQAQFIRTSLLKNYHILQPDVASGQDGVFSHLVLTHCRKTGVLKTAAIQKNTHSDSTFNINAFNHHYDVKNIVKSHLDYISEHYDKYNLWSTQSQRLIRFIIDETIRNRVYPHIAHVTADYMCELLLYIKGMVSRALGFMNEKTIAHAMHPVLQALMDNEPRKFIDIFKRDFFTNIIKYREEKDKNFWTGTLYICKYINPLMVEYANLGSHSGTNISLEKQLSDQSAQISEIKSRLDYLIQSENNSKFEILSQIASPHTDLADGMPNLVVSLTTTPERLPLTHKAIESIFHQSIRPAKIILWVSETAQNLKLSPELKALISKGVDLEYVPDVGPHTKLIYALRKYPDKNIITIDDDIYYPVHMISTLLEFHNKYPQAVIANWAREIAFDNAGKPLPIHHGALLNPLAASFDHSPMKYTPKENYLAVPYGVGGVFYPPRCSGQESF